MENYGTRIGVSMVWLIVLVGLFAIVLWYALRTEGFASPPSLSLQFLQEEETPRDEGWYGRYFGDRTNYFHKQLSKWGIVADDSTVAAIPSFDTKLQQALEVAPLFVESPPERHHADYVLRVKPSDLRIRFNACMALEKPEDLREGSECGWLFVPDADGARESYGLLGSAEGPHPNIQYTQPAGSKWFWNTQKADAIAKEQEKRCNRITVCEAISLDSPCGYNTNTRRGVVVDKTLPNTNPVIVTRPSQCPSGQGFCAAASTVAEKKECLKILLDSEGIGAQGWFRVGNAEVAKILRAVHERARTPTTLQITEGELTGETKVTLEFRKKLQYWRRLTASYDRILRDFAQMMVFGSKRDGAVFSYDDYYPTAASSTIATTQPALHSIALETAQREFRKAGCQPAGSAYPTSIPSGSLSDLRKQYRALHASLRSSIPSQQEEAVRKCINRNVTLAAGGAAAGVTRELCNERGIEYFVFEGTDKDRILIGHLYSNRGLLRDRTDSDYAEDGNLKRALASTTRYNTVSYVARTMVRVPEDVTMVADASWKKLNHAVSIDEIENDVGDLDIPLEANEHTLIEWTFSAPKTASWDKPHYAFLNLNLDRFQLYQSAKKPVFSFNFYMDSMVDSNSLAELELEGNATIQTVGEKAALVVTGAQRRSTITPRIRSRLLYILSLRVFLPTSVTTCILFTLEDQSYRETCALKNPTTIEYKVERLNTVYTKEFTIEDIRGKWANVAIAYTKLKQSNTMTLEVLVNQTSQDTKSFLLAEETFDRPLQVQLMDPSFTGGLGWFHVYDARAPEQTEGFQSTMDVEDLLEQEADFDPQLEPPTDPERPTIEQNDFMVANVPNARDPLRTVAASTVAATTGTAEKCPFEPVTGFMDISVNYMPVALYDQAFDLKASSEKTGVGSAKECEDACRDDCIAYSYKPSETTCKLYNDLGTKRDTVAAPGVFSALVNRIQARDDILKLQKDTIQAIKDYAALKLAMKDKGVLNSLVEPKQTIRDQILRAKTGLVPVITDPRSDDEIKKDLEAVEAGFYNTNAMCLNAIFKKYSIE